MFQLHPNERQSLHSNTGRLCLRVAPTFLQQRAGQVMGLKILPYAENTNYLLLVVFAAVEK